MGIFSDNAQKHWDAGLPVIPLMRGQKRPELNKWQSFANQMPSDLEKAAWLGQYANGNIGLPLGPAAGLIAIDIDTDDPKILGVLDKVLPPSPWVRIGRKGKVLIYKYDGQTTVRIRHNNPDTGKIDSVVEMLSAGTQVVLPPSIHPDTGKPYVGNRDLVDVLSEVRSLPPNIEAILRDALKEVGIITTGTGVGSVTNLVAPGMRDNRLMQMAGLFANDVCRGYKTLAEACNQIEVWALEFTEKVYGDSIDPKKGPKKLVECLIKDVTGPKRRMLPKGWDEGLTDEEKEAMGLGILTTDHETWDAEQIRVYLDTSLEKAGVRENQKHLLDIARDVIYKIAANRGLDGLDESALIRYIADVSGRQINVSEIRKMIGEYRSGEIKGQDHTEIAQAVLRDIEDLHGQVRFWTGKMWVWCGSHWSELDENIVMRHIATEYGSMKAASRASDHGGIMKIIKGLCTKELKNRDENGINFVNGFLNEDLELKPHDPDHGMTYCLHYPYLPDEAGKCTKWLAMLHDYWGPDEDYADKVNALGEAIAITMFGKATSVQKAFCLYGVAFSGKSRILEIIQALMPGEAQTSMPPTMWGDKFGTAPLADKLLNFAGELSEHNMIDSMKFKQIIEGSMIEAQFKNQQVFNFRPKAAHWFASNHLPKTRDSSEGFTRRWVFFNFPRKFPEERKIDDYDRQVIAEERTAIAAWAVQFIVRLRNENWILTDPESSKMLRDQLDNELNTVRAFLSDLRQSGRLLVGVESCKDVVGEPVVTFDTLMTEYKSYCVGASVSPVGSKTAVRRFNALTGIFGFIEEKKPNRYGGLQTQYRYLTFAGQREK